MPVPATKGQLRTTVKDMEIGDYIACRYKSTGTNVAGNLSELGRATGTEISVKGSITPDGVFYFVKVDKGLLIADRVIQYTISLATLNSAGIVFGRPEPENIALGKTTAASSIYSDSGGSASHTALTNGTTNTGGYSGYAAPNNNDPAYWCRVDLGKEYTINKIRVYADDVSNRYNVKVSTDGTSYDIVATDELVKTGWKVFDIEPVKARYIMLDGFPKDNSYGYNVARIREIEAYESSSQLTFEQTVRVPTGGVSYNSGFNSTSTTDLGKGAFPSTNEWDKYIVNFPTDLILEGKTNNDVFHWEGIYTLTSDTASEIPGMSLGTSMIIRGNSADKTLSHTLSSNALSNLGYRPLLEYKEE